MAQASEIIPVFRSPEAKILFDQAYSAALRLWPVPYEELFVATRCSQTHVIASGPQDASPLVLLQPAGCGATIWYRNVAALSRQRRVYAVDTPGEVNRSALTRPIQSRQDFAVWAAELFDGLGFERTDLVGNSFGGFLALNTALYLPERVRRVALISPAATFAPMWPFNWHYLPAYLTGSKRLIERAYAWIWQGFPVDECIARLRQITGQNGIPRHIPPVVFSDAELRRVQAPALLLIGDHEVIYRPADAIRRAVRLVPGLRAEIVPNANHNAGYTNPGVVNEKILEFLECSENRPAA